MPGPPSRSWSAGRAAFRRASQPLVWRPWHWLAVALVSLLCCKPCLAERVVLVRPVAGDVVLSEVFNRLQGELRMHGFETILASASAVPTPNEMQRVTELGQAVASVALERVALELVAHVWALDRETTEAHLMSISLQEAEETPALLALRTVELLRSRLRERIEPSMRPREPTPLPPGPVKVAAKPSPPQPPAALLAARFDLRLEGGLSWSSLGQAGLPTLAVSAGYRILPDWELAARFAFPLSSNRLTANSSYADYHVYFAGAESRWSVVLQPTRFALEPMLAMGLARCTVHGHGYDSVIGLDAAAWTMAAAAGLGAWFKPTTRLGIGSIVRTGVFLPKPLLRVEEREVSLGRPWVELNAAVNYGF